MAPYVVGSPGAATCHLLSDRLRSIGLKEETSLVSRWYHLTAETFQRMSFTVTDRERHDGSSTVGAGSEGAEAAEDGERGCHENSV